MRWLTASIIFGLLANALANPLIFIVSFCFKFSSFAALLPKTQSISAFSTSLGVKNTSYKAELYGIKMIFTEESYTFIPAGSYGALKMRY